MRQLSPTALDEFAKGHGITEEAWLRRTSDDQQTLRFVMPDTFGHVLSIMRNLLSRDFNSSWYLLILSEFGIWPSWEDSNLFKHLLNSFGLPRVWKVGDAYVFERSELDDVITFCSLFANFKWGFTLLTSQQDLIFTLNHDDGAYVYMSPLYMKHAQSFREFLANQSKNIQ